MSCETPCVACRLTDAGGAPDASLSREVHCLAWRCLHAMHAGGSSCSPCWLQSTGLQPALEQELQQAQTPQSPVLQTPRCSLGTLAASRQLQKNGMKPALPQTSAHDALTAIGRAAVLRAASAAATCKSEAFSCVCRRGRALLLGPSAWVGMRHGLEHVSLEPSCCSRHCPWEPRQPPSRRCRLEGRMSMQTCLTQARYRPL